MDSTLLQHMAPQNCLLHVHVAFANAIAANPIESNIGVRRVRTGGLLPTVTVTAVTAVGTHGELPGWATGTSTGSIAKFQERLS